MRAKTFRGGIHPKEYKELANKSPLTPAFPASKTVTIPVTMGGAPNQPLVKAGDEVSRGQIIASGNGFMNCPVHSSVSGKVKKIQNCLVTGGSEVPCIIIEADDDFMKAKIKQIKRKNALKKLIFRPVFRFIR